MIGFSLALAQQPADPTDPEVAEEVIVWQQPFARFDDKRWLVRSEVVTPAVTPLGTVKSPIRANAWQLETIVHCRLADDRGRLREADCRIEDAALRIHTADAKKETRREEAITTLAATLKGTNLQLQVHKRGNVPNTDLDGLDEGNFEKRRLATGARTLMTQVAAAFHMDFPKRDPRGHTWVAYREPLLLLASPIRGMGSMEVLHRLDVVDGRWIQQTKGRSTSTAPVPNPNAGLPCRGIEFQSERAKAANSGPGSGICPPNMLTQPDFLELEMTYALELAGVAVVDPDAGYPTERVWTVTGGPTASSPGSVTGTSYWSAGMLRELGKDETVQLGASGFVGAPGQETDDLPAWVSLATLPGTP